MREGGAEDSIHAQQDLGMCAGVMSCSALEGLQGCTASMAATLARAVVSEQYKTIRSSVVMKLVPHRQHGRHAHALVLVHDAAQQLQCVRHPEQLWGGRERQPAQWLPSGRRGRQSQQLLVM
jgi:hypothetical protein